MAIYAPRLIDKKFDVGGVIWSCKRVTHSHVNDIISMHLVNFKEESITLRFALEQIERCYDFDSLVIQEIKRRYIGAVNIETGSLNAANITSLSMSTTAAAPTVITKTGTQKEETAISMETTIGATSERLHVTSVQMQQVPKVGDRVTVTFSNSNQGENKMDAKTLAYVAANMDKVTDLIDKWGTETTWETNSVIMIDYTYARDAVVKKKKVVDIYGEEVKVYTATVFKAKDGKWYSSLQNNKLHGVEFGDVINFFENAVTVIKAVAFTYGDGIVFLSKGKLSA